MAITNSTRDDSSDITEIAVTNIEETMVEDTGTAPVVSAAGTDAALLEGDLSDPALHAIASAGQELPLDQAEVLPDAREPTPTATPDPELLSWQLNRLVASVVAVEELSRQARDVAATDLGLYEGMLASRRQFEASLGEAQRLRVQAEQVLERAFGQQARATAEPLVAEARQVEQAFAQLAESWQRQADAFLDEHPDVQALLAEQRREQEAARRQEAALARARRLQALVADADEALAQGVVGQARQSLQVLQREFPEEGAHIERLRQGIEQQVRAEKDAAARAALNASAEAQARGDLEGAVRALEEVDVRGLSADVSEDVFGKWSDACSRLAQAAELADVRFSPVKGRGLILYRDPQYPSGLVVLSALGMGSLYAFGKVVSDPFILERARPYRAARPLPDVTAWESLRTSYVLSAPSAPVRH